MSIINLENPQVDVREHRLGSITGFEGSASRLVGCSRNGSLCERNRSFSQCLGCSTSQAACTVVLIQDAAVISHGPVGCCGSLHEYAFTYRVNGVHRGLEHPTQRRIFSTNLGEEDTVFGGTRKLAEAIREVHRRTAAKAIFIITTCASGIIGDDVEGVAAEAEAELGVPVVAIFCEGFRSRIWTSGFDAGYHGIARKLIPPAARKQPDLVNVINFWGADIFTGLLGRIGLRPNYITPYATVASLAQSAEAAATIQICETLGSYLGAALEQVHGVPEIKLPPPYGTQATDRWWRELGRITGREGPVETLLREEQEACLPRIAELRAQLKGKRAYVTAGAAHGHALVAILRELGLTVAGAAVFHHDPVYDNGAEASDSLGAVVRDHGDIPRYTVCNKQEFELVNVLRRERPDILLARHGGMTLWGARLGIPSLLVGDEHFGMGYQGLVHYGERILETLENDEFVRNLARHAVNPYTDWWLAQDPYLFLEGKPHAGNH
ncbi:MAG: nitrogenase component 1 [Holophaga sp.]|nr:nitrogenase component 1 [Holophaga sp.]